MPARAIRLGGLGDGMHDDLRERWLYPSGPVCKKKIGGADETASTASHTTGYRMGRGQSAGAGMICNLTAAGKVGSTGASRLEQHRDRLPPTPIHATRRGSQHLLFRARRGTATPR